MPPSFVCPNPTCQTSIAADGLVPPRCPRCDEPTGGTEVLAPAVLEPGQGVRETLPVPPSLAESRTGSAGFDVSVPPSVTEPQQVGRFVVVGVLGEGAFGVVYRAHDPHLDRPVALKVAKPGALDSPAKVERFLREAKAAANLRHPNIVPLYESGRDGDRYFIAAALVEGTTLAENLRAGGGIYPPRRAADVARKLADALGYAHRQGVVHRDVKPANVLVDGLGEPVLADFGLAVRATDAKVTRDGAAVGTPAYMAPEQAGGHGRAASDQYAVGCVLYELLTGRTPFRGTAAQQMFLHMSEVPPPPRSVNPAVPRDLDTVVRKCLEKEPANRYPTCDALADDLRRWLAGEAVAARRVGPIEALGKWAKRNPGVAASLAVALLALTVGTAVSLWQADAARRSADLAEQRARDAQTEAERADDEARRARDEAERADDATRQARTEATRADAAARTARAEAARADGEATRATRFAEEAKAAAAAARAEAKENRRLLDFARLRDAQAALDHDLGGEAKKALDAVEPENRCVVWRLLKRSVEGALFALRGHTDAVRGVACSPDGQWIATASDDHTARIWDARTGQIVRVLTGHTGRVVCVAFSRDGSRVATSSEDKTARVWETRSGRSVAELRGHGNFVTGVAFGPDADRVVTGSSVGFRTGEVRVWDVKTATVVREMKNPGGAVDAVAFAPDGRTVAAGMWDRTAVIWDAMTGDPVWVLKGHTDRIYSVAFSPDGTRLATGCRDRTVRIWNTATGDPVRELEPRSGFVAAVAFSPDGSRIAVAAITDETARSHVNVWDARTGARLLDLRGQIGLPRAICFSADGARLVTGSRDGEARVWEAANPLGIVTADGAGPGGVAVVSPDGSAFATGQDPLAVGKIGVWDTRRGRRLFDFGKHTPNLISVAFSGDAARIAAGLKGGGAVVWDAAGGKILREFTTTPKAPVAGAVALSPDGTLLAAGSGEYAVRVWDVATGDPRHVLTGFQGPVAHLAFSPDGARLVTGCSRGMVRLWDLRPFAAKPRVEVHAKGDRVEAVAASPDGTRIVAASNRGGIAHVWDGRTGEYLFELPDPSRTVTAVAFSADGTRIATASKDGGVRFWDPKTGQQILELRATPGTADRVAFAADGNRLFTTGGNAVRAWDTSPDDAGVRELVGHTGMVFRTAESPDGTRVASVSADTTGRVWDAGTGRPIAVLTGHTDYVMDVVFSPDGTRIATGSRDYTVRVWDAASGRAVAVLRGHKHVPHALAFSPDGSRIATGAVDKTAIVWDIATAKPVVGPLAHTGQVGAVAFSADGTRLATASGGFKLPREVRVWDATTGRPIHTLDGFDQDVRTLRFSADGTRLESRGTGERFVWDVAAGRKLPDPVRPAFPTIPSVPDVAYLPVGGEFKLVRVPAVVPENLARIRFRRTAPQPAYHRAEAERMKREGNPSAAAIQRSLEQRAVGQELIDAGGIGAGFWHLVAAELLAPDRRPAARPTP